MGRALGESRWQGAGREARGIGGRGRRRLPGSAVPPRRAGVPLRLHGIRADAGAQLVGIAFRTGPQDLPPGSATGVRSGAERGVRSGAVPDVAPRIALAVVTSGTATSTSTSTSTSTRLFGTRSGGPGGVPLGVASRGRYGGGSAPGRRHRGLRARRGRGRWARGRWRPRRRVGRRVPPVGLRPPGGTGPLGAGWRHRAGGARVARVAARVVRGVRVPWGRRVSGAADTVRRIPVVRRTGGVQRPGGRGESVVQGVRGARGPRVLGGVVVQLPPPVVLVTGGPTPLLAHAPDCPPHGPDENGASGKCATARVSNRESSDVLNGSARHGAARAAGRFHPPRENRPAACGDPGSHPLCAPARHELESRFERLPGRGVADRPESVRPSWISAVDGQWMITCLRRGHTLAE